MRASKKSWCTLACLVSSSHDTRCVRVCVCGLPHRSHPAVLERLLPVMRVAIRIIIPSSNADSRRTWLDPAAAGELLQAAVKLVASAFAPKSAWEPRLPQLVKAVAQHHVDDALEASHMEVARGPAAEAVCVALGAVLLAAARTGSSGSPRAATSSAGSPNAATEEGTDAVTASSDPSQWPMFATLAQCAAAVRLVFGAAGLDAVASMFRTVPTADASTVGAGLELSQAHLALIGAAAAYSQTRKVRARMCNCCGRAELRP